MPRRNLPKEDNAAALAAIREALKSPHYLSAEEEAAFQAMRTRAGIERGPGTTIAFERRGRLVFRTEGKAGPDMDELPQSRERRRRQRDFAVALSKASRRAPPPQMGVQTRQAKSEALKTQILRLADRHVTKGRHRAAFIADKLQVTAKYVREVIKKRT